MSVFFLAGPCAWAQDSDQSSSGSGVLVSPSAQSQSTDNASGSSDTDRQSISHTKKQRDGQGEGNPSNAAADNTSNWDTPPKDEIVVKSADAVIFQMKANLKLTQDQIDAARPIVEDNVTQVRALQQKLEDGSIDGKTMYDQRDQLTVDENRKLGTILTSDQLKLWISIESQNYIPPAHK